MTSEKSLMLFISCVLFYSYAGLYVSHQAGAPIPRWSNLLKSRDYTFYLIYICFIALIINAVISLVRGEYLLPLFLIGLALILFSAYLNIVARRELVQFWSPLSSSFEGQRLIKSGIYARVRHPVYLSLLIYCSGVTLVAGNWCGWILFIIFLGGLRGRIKKEEEELYRTFGEEYRAYVKETPPLLPKLRKRDIEKRNSL